MSIESLDDLRPGDIMLCAQADAPARILVNVGQLLLHDQFRIGDFTAGHAGIISTRRTLIEAMPSGARERKLRRSDWSPDHMYFRLPEMYPGQAFDAATIAQTMLGTPYSFASYVYLGAYLAGLKLDRLAKHIDRRHPPELVPGVFGGSLEIRRPVEAICSVLVDQAWTMAGYSLIHGTRPQVVTPGMLAKQLWFSPSSVEFGGAAMG